MNKLEKLIFKDLTRNNFTLKRAKELTGGGITSQNKKMPFYNYDLSAYDWIPTRETKILKDLKEQNIIIPKNCVFRVSAPLIDGFLNSKVFKNTSAVISNKDKARNKDKNCPSLNQGGQCLDCRNCWDNRIKNINYLIH